MTRTDFFRQRILPVAFGLAIALLARKSCQTQDHTTATFVLDFGGAAADVHAVDVDVWAQGALVSHFHRTALAPAQIGATRFTGALPDPDGELRIDVELATGVRHVVRPFHADDGGTVTVPLERDLR